MPQDTVQILQPGEVCMCVAHSHEAGMKKMLFVVPTISKAELALRVHLLYLTCGLPCARPARLCFSPEGSRATMEKCMQPVSCTMQQRTNLLLVRDAKLALQSSQLALQPCYVSLLLHNLLLQCLMALVAPVHICTVELVTQL